MLGLLNDVADTLTILKDKETKGSTTIIEGDTIIRCTCCGNIVFKDNKCILCGTRRKESNNNNA
jgi:hypothetical protein